MRYAASEKLEIIRTVETSHMPVRRTLDKIGIPKTTFYAWLDRYAASGFDALDDRKPRLRRVSITRQPIGGRVCSPITARPTSPTIWPNGSKTRECGTRAANRIIQ